MKFYILFFLQTVFCFSQNHISVLKALNVKQNQTLSIPLGLESKGDISTFQFDVNYNNNAFEFTNSNLNETDLDDHDVLVTEIDSNTIRIKVLSNQSFIIGEGDYVITSLMFNTKEITGDFSFEISNIVSNVENFQVSPFLVSVEKPDITFKFSGGSINKYTPLTVNLSVLNQTPIKAIQFDLNLPDYFNLETSSIEHFERLVNHDISVVLISPNTYRFVIYSTENSLLSVGDDVVLNFKLKTTESEKSTFYPVVENIKIVDVENQLLLSNIEVSEIDILPKSLQIVEKIDLGKITLKQLKQFTISVDNVTNVNHQIYNIKPSLFDYYVSLPSIVNSNNSSEFIFQFIPENIGFFEETIRFIHSGNESVSEVLITANVVSLNYFSAKNEILGDSNNHLNISLITSEISKAFQFDLNVPSGFNIDSNNIILDESFNNFNLEVTQVNPNKFRFLLYTNNHQIINTGKVNMVSIPLLIDDNVQSNFYEIQFSNCTIVSNQNKNIYNSESDISSFYYTEENIEGNYLSVRNVITNPGISQNIDFNLINNEKLKALQFDVFINDFFNFSIENFELTSRASNFDMSVSEIDNSKYRFIIYSTNTESFIEKGNAPIIRLKCNVNTFTPIGNYFFDFDNVKLVNTLNQNINTPAKEIGVVFVDDPASLKSSESQVKFNVYPNPTNRFIWINGEYYKIRKIEIMTILGQKVITFESGFDKLDVTELKKGVYVMKIESIDDNFQNIRFIKN